ncbi:MAG TPA: cyclic nucleotide-binding domain-containing protein, partial [Methylibium sp.]
MLANDVVPQGRTSAAVTMTAGRLAARAGNNGRPSGEGIADALKLLQEKLPLQKRLVRAGDTVYQAGEKFASLYILNAGFFKLLNVSADGREQVVGLKFKGDWLGFDGIAG